MPNNIEALGGGGAYSYTSDTEPNDPDLGETWLDTSSDPALPKVYADTGNGPEWQYTAAVARILDFIDSKISETQRTITQKDEPNIADVSPGTKWYELGTGEIWRYTKPSSGSESGAVYDPDNEIYVFGTDGNDNGGSAIWAVSADDGSEYWTWDETGGDYGPIYGLISDDTQIYANWHDGSGGTFAIDKSNGSNNWEYSPGTRKGWGIAQSDTHIFTTEYSSDVAAKVDKSSGNADDEYTGTSYARETEITFIESDSELLYGDHNGNIYSLDTTNMTENWKISPASRFRAGSNADGTRFYTVDESGNVYGVNRADGVIDWTESIPNGKGSFPILDSEGLVFLSTTSDGDGDAALVALNVSDGSVAWEKKGKNYIGSSPAYFARKMELENGSLYVNTYYDSGYLLKVDPVTGDLENSRLLAESGLEDRGEIVRGPGDKIFTNMTGDSIVKQMGDSVTEYVATDSKFLKL